MVPGACATFAEGGGPAAQLPRRLLEDRPLLPGFKPRWTVRRGVEELYDAYARNGLTFEQFTGSRYLRINRVKELQEAGRLDQELRLRPPVGAG